MVQLAKVQAKLADVSGSENLHRLEQAAEEWRAVTVGQSVRPLPQ
jgi:hypothetical protein